MTESASTTAAELRSLALELLARAEVGGEPAGSPSHDAVLLGFSLSSLPVPGAEPFPGAEPAPAGSASKDAVLIGSRSPSVSSAAGSSAVPEGGPSSLEAVAQAVQACRACPLGSQRIKAVPGIGKAGARVMLVGEGPGFEEDRKGEPFVGKAGALLDRILESIGLSREAVYITNIVKCHPMADPSDPEKRGNDRPPEPDEMRACRAHLDEQIRLVAPRVIVALGAVAGKALCGTQRGITALRGEWHEYRGIPVLPTFHPAALLRNPELKRDVWTDMKSLKRALEEPS